MVPSPRLVHTPNSVAITLGKDEEKRFDNILTLFYQQNSKTHEFLEKYSQVPEYINEVTRPAKDAVTNEGVEARLHCKRQPLPKINEVLR